MEFRILGPLQVLVDGKPLRLSGSKQRTLLAALLVSRDRVVSTERLIELVWGDEPPDSAENALQVHVSHLRKLLEPTRRGDGPKVVISNGSGYVLALGPGQLDAQCFERLTSAGRRILADGDHREAARLLREALALWRGPALADIDTPFATAERLRLDELRLAALADRIDADLNLGLHTEVVAELQALQVQQQQNERFCGQLMLALARSGRQAEATAIYHRLRQLLDAELGMEPGPALQQLYVDILNQQIRVGHVTISGSHGNTLNRRPLPRSVSSFIGREREIAEVRRLIGVHRLVTITGTGGVGKTRLAEEVAASIQDTYADGAYLVKLAGLGDASVVPHIVATALGIEEQGQRPLLNTVLDGLRARSVIIVLDNCEHLVEACASITERILRATDAVRILATSREPLRIDGEAISRLQPLAVPPAIDDRDAVGALDYPSVRLFVERAAAVCGGFELTDDTSNDVAALCVRLDGIPLALELAASRLSGLTPRQLNHQLDQRFRLLVGGNRNALPRQQTLRATIDWSYQLLDPLERILFERLAVFSGGWSMASAEAVCADVRMPTADVVPVMLRLIDKSLVVVEQPSPTSVAEQRYRFLETVSEYARERLESSGDVADICRRHANLVLDLARGAEQKVSSRDAAKWLSAMETEVDNLRTVLAWSEREDPEVCLSLATTWAHIWLARGYFSEGRQWLSRAIAAAPASASVLVQAYNQAQRLAFFQGDLEAARHGAEAGLRIARARDDRVAVASFLNALGICAEDLTARRNYLQESLAVSQDAEYQYGIAQALANLAGSAGAANQLPEARRLYAESLRITFQLGDMRGATIVYQGLGYVDLQEGDFNSAELRFRESLRIAHERGDRRWIAEGLDCLALSAGMTGRAHRALRLAAAARACGESIGMIAMRQLAGWWVGRHVQNLDQARQTLGPDVSDTVWAEGSRMLPDDAVAYALDEDAIA